MPSQESTTFFEALRIQKQVIWALIMREIITRYGRKNLGFLWMFLAPMLLIGLIVSLRIVRAEETHGVSIAAFALTGYSGAFMLRKVASRCVNAIEPNRTLMFHRNVRILDIYAARMTLEVASETMAFLFLLIGCWFLGLIPQPDDALKVLTGWLLLTWFGCALAITVGPLSDLFDWFSKIWVIFSLLLLILSGAFFMVDWLPEPTRNFLLLLPWIHGMELLREGYFGGLVRAHYNLSYIIIWSLIGMLLGLLLMRIAAKQKA